MLFVVVSLGFTVFNSEAFKKLFGPNAEAFTKLRKRMEYNYRYTQTGAEDTLGSNYSGRHDSYISASSEKTHFFAPMEAYK